MFVVSVLVCFCVLEQVLTDGKSILISSKWRGNTLDCGEHVCWWRKGTMPRCQRITSAIKISYDPILLSLQVKIYFTVNIFFIFPVSKFYYVNGWLNHKKYVEQFHFVGWKKKLFIKMMHRSWLWIIKNVDGKNSSKILIESYSAKI